MPFKFAPGTRRKFTLMRDAMLAGTSHNPYTSSFHDLSAAKVRTISEFCKFFANFSFSVPTEHFLYLYYLLSGISLPVGIPV